MELTAMVTLRGWIFDVEEESRGMRLWVVDIRGHTALFHVPYRPSFFVSGSPSGLAQARRFLEGSRAGISVSRTQRREFYSNQALDVLRVQLHDPLRYAQAVRSSLRSLRNVEFHTCDIPIPQLFFYETGLFPLAFVEVQADEAGRVSHLELQDSPESVDYSLPPLRIMQLRAQGPDRPGMSVQPSHRSPDALCVGVEDREYVLEPDGVIPALRALVRRFDPHIILSEWGDSFLLRRLSLLARRFGEPLPFDRGNTRTRPEQRGRSYFSYGRIVYFAPSQFLSGRWHLDTRNSFVCAESGLNGLFELARLSKIPVQRLARLSTGTCISSMQLDVAIRQGYLIPWQKKVPEEFKDAEELLVTDKGGLTYQPVIGFHEQVAELDFASMYPTLMARYNLSPETVNCTCCPDVPPVPEAGYRICQKRKGLIATTLEPILRRRRIYKERRRDAGTPEERALYDRRQNALKWILVTCFGFLGYRNARFGKIEAHESTTAWGREKMLVAKELAESLGFAFLHGLTDSLWVRKEGATEEDYHRLADAASEATGLTVSLEGIYDWIAFLPSRQDPRVAVPSRYFGLFRGGDLKIRGLDLRRHDTPPWIKMVQGELLEIVRHAHTRREYAERIPLVLERLQVHIADLRASRVDPLQLAITRRLTQEPLSYRKPSYAAIAAQEMTARGIALHPGEKIQFLLTATRSPLPSDRAKAIGFLDGTEAYDIPKYEELLLRAAEPLFIHFGWDCARLRGHFSAAFCHSERSAAK